MTRRHDPARDARRARIMSAVWWTQAPIVLALFLLDVAPSTWRDGYIAFASIAAMGVTYSGKAKAADAERAAEGNTDG